MITKINSKTFLDNNEVAYTVEAENSKVNGNALKMYIPKIMSGITKGTPYETIKTVNTSNVFINDSSCKIKAKQSVKLCNYIECTLDTSSSGISIPKNTKLKCYTTNGNIQKITIEL